MEKESSRPILRFVEQEWGNLPPIGSSLPPSSVLVARCGPVADQFIEIRTSALDAWANDGTGFRDVPLRIFEAAVGAKDWREKPYFEQAIVRFASVCGSDVTAVEMAWGGQYWETLLVESTTSGEMIPRGTHSVG